MERHIIRERNSSHIFFQEPGVANACTPLQAHQRQPDRLHISRSTAFLCTQSKSDLVVLITWSPSGYTPVWTRPTCLLITRWQLVKAHGVTRNKLKIHVIYYITQQGKFLSGVQLLWIQSFSSFRSLAISRLTDPAALLFTNSWKRK